MAHSRSTWGAASSCPLAGSNYLDLVGWLTPRERERGAEKVTSREEKGGGDAARSITSHGDISRHFRFHSPFTSRGYETLFGGSEGGGGRGGKVGRRQRRKQRAFARELISIGLPWILSALTSRRRIPLLSSCEEVARRYVQSHDSFIL